MMPKVVLNTRADLTSKPAAKFGTFELASTTTVSGWKLAASVAPVFGELTKVRTLLLVCVRIHLLLSPRLSAATVWNVPSRQAWQWCR